MSSNPTTPKTAPHPRQVYNHALLFLGTEAFLRSQCEADPPLEKLVQFPGMVICAFAAELFLKSLTILEGGTPKNTHNLLTLYSELNTQNQALVERHWNNGCRARKDSFDDIEKRYNVKVPRDLKTALCDCGNAFNGLRYAYENPRGTLFYITHLPISLRFAIQEVTGWSP